MIAIASGHAAVDRYLARDFERVRGMSSRFAAAIDLGGDPDPLRQHDLLPTLVEPARTWWLTRLGDPTAEPVRRERERIRAAATSGAAWVDAAPGTGFDELSAAEVERLWEFLASRLAVAP